ILWAARRGELRRQRSQVAGRLHAKRLHVTLQHLSDHAIERDVRYPPQALAGPTGVTAEVADLRRTYVRRVNLHVLRPVKTHHTERGFDKIFDATTDAARDDVVIGSFLLEHQPHGDDVVASVTPVSARIEIAQ